MTFFGFLAPTPFLKVFDDIELSKKRRLLEFLSDRAAKTRRVSTIPADGCAKTRRDLAS